MSLDMVDLLVIDEASQCSIADVLPLAYRAKRILVVGDPNQLAPSSPSPRAHWTRSPPVRARRTR